MTAFPKRIQLALLVRVHWGMRCAPTPIRQSPQAQCSISRWSTPMVSLYTLIRFHYICPVQAARRKTSSCLTVGKPRYARSPAVSRTRYYMVLRYAQNTVCAGQGERPLAPHCRQSAARFTLTFCSSRCPRQQVPIRAEKCEHIVLQPTNPPIMMWAAFWTGSAWRRWALRCGHRLTAHYISRVSRRQAASTPDFATAKTAHPALIGRYHCALRLIPH